MTDHERIERLERCLLSVVSIVTGELQKVTSAEEFELAQNFLGKELEEMKEGL